MMPVDALVKEAQGLPEELIMNAVYYLRFLKSEANGVDRTVKVDTSTDPAEFAAECYRRHAASVGRCAQMAGMSEEDFILYLGESGLSLFQYNDEQEFLEDLENA